MQESSKKAKISQTIDHKGRCDQLEEVTNKAISTVLLFFSVAAHLAHLTILLDEYFSHKKKLIIHLMKSNFIDFWLWGGLVNSKHI